MLPGHEAEIGGKLPAALEQAGVRDAGRETGSHDWTNPRDGGQPDADRIAAMSRQNGFVEPGNLRLDPEQHRGQRLKRNSSRCGEVWIVLMEESEQLARVAGPLRHHDAQLCKVTAQGIDQGRPLPDQKIADPVQHEGALLLWDLDRNETHGRPRDGLTDGCRVRGIILLPAQIRFDISGGIRRTSWPNAMSVRAQW